MPAILFRSTNRSSRPATFREALLKGQPPDYGLYMPERIPRLSSEEIASFGRMRYPEIAFRVLRPFLEGSLPDTALADICDDCYTFEVPLETVRDGFCILRLDRGPTASFKDFAARWMARVMAYIAREDNVLLTVLVATSGDTGGAVADAFFGIENIRVVVLFPEKEVTERQRRQMTTLGGNITAAAVRGKFDDCQAMAKNAFSDPGLATLNLTSANSINIGRLLPQAVYYFHGFAALGVERAVFSVPSGNFGDLMGGVFAREMGLPTGRFIVAVNANDEFPRFLETGTYRPVIPSRECSSNAMNVGHPSNLARLVDLYGGWLLDERNRAGSVVRRGVLRRTPDMERMRRDFESYAVTDREAEETIRSMYRGSGTLLEPHGAVAVTAALKSKTRDTIICLETAHPAKFPEQIRSLLGFDPALPPSMAGLDGKRERYETLENDFRALREFLLNLP